MQAEWLFNAPIRAEIVRRTCHSSRDGTLFFSSPDTFSSRPSVDFSFRSLTIPISTAFPAVQFNKVYPPPTAAAGRTSLGRAADKRYSLYGEYPSPLLKKYAENIVTFNSQVTNFKLDLPTLYEFVFNNFTTHQGAATAFESVKNELVTFCYEQSQVHPELFTPFNHPITDPTEWASAYVSDTKDFHTAGKVSASLGIPLHRLPEHTSYKMPDGEVVKIPAGNYEASLAHIQQLVSKIR